MARRLHTARRTDPLARAMGLAKRKTPPTIVDTTAGLGRDAFVLAHLGCPVTAIERVPALAFLLHIAANECLHIDFRIVLADAARWLRDLPLDQAPQIAYLDPMFSEHGRAQVKKEMQACRAIADLPLDEQDLLAAARAVASERVVVKRHPQLAPIAADVSHAVTADRVRFDVYLA